MRKIVLAMFCLNLVIVLLPNANPPALACSGPPPVLDYAIAESDVVVEATVLSTDSSTVNALLQVSRYLVGKPQGEFLLVQKTTATKIQDYRIHPYSSHCDVGEDLVVGQKGIVSLRQNLNGSYMIWAGGYGRGFYVFPNPDTTVEVNYLDDLDNFVTISVTQEQLTELILEEAQSEPELPDFSRPKPIFAPLLATTNTGTTYLLPMDFGTPIQLSYRPRLAFEPPRQVLVTKDYEIRYSQSHLAFIAFDSFRRMPHYEIYCPIEECIQASHDEFFLAYQSALNEITICDLVGDSPY